MRLRVFQATDGDCLLLSSDDDRHMLIDGGRSGSFKEHSAKSLSNLEALEVVCVSHIDADHISGVLTLLEAEVDWRIHLFEKDNPPEDRQAKRKPSVPRPPRVKEIWHNGFSNQLGTEAGDVHNMLSLAATAQLGLADSDAIPRERYFPDLVNGEEQGIELSHRIGEDQLDVPLNDHFGGKLVRGDGGAGPFELGSAKVTIIGPFAKDLENLQAQWRKWVDANGGRLEDLRREMEGDAERLGLSEADVFISTMRAIVASSSDFGNRDDVSTPNLASIMFLAEGNDASVLLTGDGAGQDILNGLGRAGKLDEDGRIHVDILKIQHHGAKANINLDFLKAVIAEHYVFSGNGAHTNPELGVIDLVAKSRFGSDSQSSKHANVGDPFTLHFNSSQAAANTDARTKHMAKVEEKVEDLTAASHGQMTARFIQNDFLEINV